MGPLSAHRTGGATVCDRHRPGRAPNALLSMCTDDIVFMPPGGATVAGEAVRPWLEGFPPIHRMSWDVDALETSGATAFLRGPVRQTLEIEGQTVEFDGKFVDHMRRAEDGSWRFSVVIWNANQP